MTRIAVIGDVHACIDELQELYSKLCHHSLDEIWICGDYVDRGPDSGAVVQFARERGIKGIKGNHEAVILEFYNRGKLPKNPDKGGTIESIRSDEDWKYLQSLPPLHIIDPLNTVLVHGGLFPSMALYKQPENLICRLQLIHPNRMDHTKWFNCTKDGVMEEELRKQGYVRWYEAYNHEQHCVFGHSVFKEPHVFQGSNGGKCFAVDTGCVFGGKLTALILDKDNFSFVQVKAKRAYHERRQGHDSSFGVSI